MTNSAGSRWDESTEDLVHGWGLTTDSEPGPAQVSTPTTPPQPTRRPIGAGSSGTSNRLTSDTFIVPPTDFGADANSDEISHAWTIRKEVHASQDRFETPEPKLAFPRAGALVGGFRIVSELGRGAFARVYLAVQVELANRRVALKVSQALGDEPQLLARLQHAHIVPIHSVHDDPESGLRLLCMPYLGGANLAEVLEAASGQRPSRATGESLVDALDQLGRRMTVGLASLVGPSNEVTRVDALRPRLAPSSNRPLEASAVPRRPGRPGGVTWLGCPAGARASRAWFWTWKRERASSDSRRRFFRKASYIQSAVWITARLAEGLDHAHSRGLLHRDLKPSNILIAADGTPMLLDFNLSADSGAPEPDEGAKAMIGGTLPYMAPEHLDAFNPEGSTPTEAVDARSDVYALGLILFEMIAGHHPFTDPPHDQPIIEVLRQMTEERLRGSPSLRAANPQVPWSLDALLKKCLDPDPNRRYSKARDLAEDLRRFLDDLPLAHVSEPSLRERAAKWGRRNPGLLSTTTVGGLALGLLMAALAVVGILASNLRTASAKSRFAAFQETFRKCQVLLNVTSGPVDHLDQGVAESRRALDAYGVGKSDDWRENFLVRRLSPRQRDELFHEITELILLEARARVTLAQHGTEADQRRALLWGVEWLDRAERIDPEPSAALFEDRGLYRAKLGLAKEAARDRARASRTKPLTARDFYLIGTSLLAQHRPDEAEPRLARAVALDPQRFWAWFLLGLCHSDLGRHIEAAGDFSVCTVLTPDFAWSHMNRGLELAKSGRLTEARTAYDRALAVSPDYVEALVNRSLTCLELDDSAQAERDLARAIALGRREPSILAAHAEALSRTGRRDLAERRFAELLKAHPDDPMFLNARGFFFLAFDQARAETDFQRVLVLDSRNPRAHLGLAFARRAVEPRAALAHLDLALAASPNFLDALQLRALIRAHLGESSALTDLDQLLQAPTPERLFNAACAVSILSKTSNNSLLIPQALNYLGRALDGGYPSALVVKDHDLDPIRDRPEFRRLLELNSARRGKGS